MSSTHQAAVERFLAAHQAELAEITMQAFTGAGGHYLAQSESARRQQAAGDAREWAYALQTKIVDQAAIERVVADGGTQAMLEDIVRMSMEQERLFRQFVDEALPEQPELARELQQRASRMAARFRMALTAAGMTAVVRAAGLPRESEPVADLPGPPPSSPDRVK